MATALKLGPADHGRRLTLEEYEAAEYAPGHKYELIRGKLEVSPLPDQSHDFIEKWLFRRLIVYSEAHPEVINHLTDKSRVFVQEREDVSAPEPDIAAYRDYPMADASEVNWQEITPVLVIEVIDPDNPRKDLTRNPDVYHSVASIREYWVVDTRREIRRPELIVHRRHGRGWRIIHVPHRGTYTTRLLPGFELILDPFSEAE